jgi:hypothetical protein
MPVGIEIVAVAAQNTEIYIWGICNPEAAKEERAFIVISTGDDLSNSHGEHIGTVLPGDGSVYHVFEANSSLPGAWIEEVE